MKRIYMLGCGSKAGAWKVRGEQLGQAIGATVCQTLDEFHGHDLVVAVKRPRDDDILALHKLGVPIVWDVVDAFPQPIANWWVKDAAIAWLKQQVKRIRPTAIVAATDAMAEDCKLFGLPMITLRHHARPNLGRAPIREDIRTVGYEGGQQYLGWWAHNMREMCEKRGWVFNPKPQSLNDLDIVVAVREADGYPARFWKSNIKLANAQGAGVPVVCNRESGYLETASGAELWADTPEEMDIALEQLTLENGARHDRADRLYASRPRIDAIAAQYREWLETL